MAFLFLRGFLDLSRLDCIVKSECIANPVQRTLSTQVLTSVRGRGSLGDCYFNGDDLISSFCFEEKEKKITPGTKRFVVL